MLSWPARPGGAFVATCALLREARSSGRLAHATIAYWPWREGAKQAARSILVNPQDIADVSLAVCNAPDTSWQERTLAHMSLCMIEMRLRDLKPRARASGEIVVRNPTLLETTSVFAPANSKGEGAYLPDSEQVLRRVRDYTSMGEPHAGLTEHVRAVGDPDSTPFALFGLPPATAPEGLARYLGAPRIKDLGLDLVVADLTSTGRSEIRNSWEKKLGVLLTALGAIQGRRPALFVLTDDSFTHRRAFSLLRMHAEKRRPKIRAQQLGLFLEKPTLRGPAAEPPRDTAPLSVQADIKDAALAPLRQELLAIGGKLRDYGADDDADQIKRALAFVRRSASLPLGMREARDITDVLYDEVGEFDDALKKLFRPKMALSDLLAVGLRQPTFAPAIDAVVQQIERKVANWEEDTPVAAKLAELLTSADINSGKTSIALPGRRISEVYLASDRAVHCNCAIVDHHSLLDHLEGQDPERLIVIGPTPESIRALLTARKVPSTVYLLGDAAGSSLLSSELAAIETIPEFSQFAVRAKALTTALRRGGADESLDQAEAEFHAAPLVKERGVDFTQSDGRYRGDVVHLMMQSGIRLDYRPGGEVLKQSPGELRPFERAPAREIRKDDRILVLDASIREPLRLALATSRTSQAGLCVYHGEIERIRTRLPGGTIAEKARHVLAIMKRIDATVGDEQYNIQRWLRADIAPATAIGTRAPGAARDWNRFRIFMEAVGVDSQMAEVYWKAAVLPTRSYRAHEGHQFNQRVVSFVLDKEAEEAWKTKQGLWQQVLESVDVVIDVEKKSVGASNG
ncbi:hypothetical protein RPB_2533 [Rhodopseudomonas palustris HaA2]|uniref:Uncharacterized protein n=2 Tax=Rhodopseudomonas palustris TaxID=1076 RepID=Q2IX22_RHOP2|nr:hypothetical protein RPB_2533 [Rhodopseudomonas palustris HaA2]